MSKKSNPGNVKAVAKEKPNASAQAVFQMTNRYVFILCLAVSFLFYGNTLKNGYAMDDELVTLHQKNVEQGLAGIPKILTSRYSVNEKQNYEYRPMVLITYAIEYQFFGRNPAVSHFLNVLLYAFAAFLLYKTLIKIFGDDRWRWVFTAVLIFLIHPIHNEVVASLKNRDELLVLIFGLFAFNQFLQFSDNTKLKHVLFGVAFMTLALLSKKSAMFFVGIIPFTLIYYKGVKNVSKVVYLVLGAVMCIVLVKLAMSLLLESQGQFARTTHVFENPLYSKSVGPIKRMIFALGTFGFYSKMMLVPYPLVCYYGYNTFEGLQFSLYHLIGVFVTASTFFVLFKYWKTNKELVLSVAMYSGGVLIVSNLVSPMVGIHAERFAFFASIGFSLILSHFLLKLKPFVSGGTSLLNAFNSNQRIVLSVLILAGFLVNFNRNNAWANSNTLYKNDIRFVPRSAKLHSLLGAMYAQKINEDISTNRQLQPNEVMAYTDSSIYHFRRALAIYPEYPAVNNNLGTMYFTFKANYDSAFYFFSSAIKADPDYVEGHYNRASANEYFCMIQEDRYNFSLSIPLSEKPVDSVKSTNPLNIGLKKDFLNKLTIRQNIEKILNSKQSGGRNTMGNALMYYNGMFSEEVKAQFDPQALTEQILNAFTSDRFAIFKKDPTHYIDSVLNKAYYPAFVKGFSLSYNDTTHKSSSVINQKVALEKIRKECLDELRLTLKLKPDYNQAFNKLNFLLEKWGKIDEMIALNKEFYSNKKYKSFSLDFNLARAYYLKRDFKEMQKRLMSGLTTLESILKRYKIAGLNFSAAGNSTAALACVRTIQMNISNVKRVVELYIMILDEQLLSKESSVVKETLKRIEQLQ